MGLYENMARLKEANLCNIVLVPSRLSASGRNKLHHHHHVKAEPGGTKTGADITYL